MFNFIQTENGWFRLFGSLNDDEEYCKNGVMGDPRQKHKAYCNHCKKEGHFIEMKGGDDYIQPANNDPLKSPPRLIWRLMQCMSCGMDIVFYMDYMGNQGYYPARSLESGQPFEHLPENLHKIYYEVHNSLQNFNSIVTAIAIRAIVEGVCDEKGIKTGPPKKEGGKRRGQLEGKIDGLLEKQVINKAQCDALHSFRFMGNKAVHKLEEPSLDELILAIQILESVLRSTFELPEKVKALGRIKSESEAIPS